MPVNEGYQQTEDGLFLAAELPRFDGRQAHKATVGFSSENQFIDVEGDEVLRINTTRLPETSLTTSGSQLWLIQEIVRNGTIDPEGLKDTSARMSLLKVSLESEAPDSEMLHMVYDTMKAAFDAEKQMRINARIRRAAGHIAARDNLWVVTKKLPAGAGAIDIGLARLVGLAAENEHSTFVVPVVKGRNQKHARLHTIPRGDLRIGRGVNVRTVYESNRTRPSH